MYVQYFEADKLLQKKSLGKLCQLLLLKHLGYKYSREKFMGFFFTCVFQNFSGRFCAYFPLWCWRILFIIYRKFILIVTRHGTSCSVPIDSCTSAWFPKNNSIESKFWYIHLHVIKVLVRYIEMNCIIQAASQPGLPLSRGVLTDVFIHPDKNHNSIFDPV